MGRGITENKVKMKTLNNPCTCENSAVDVTLFHFKITVTPSSLAMQNAVTCFLKYMEL